MILRCGRGRGRGWVRGRLAAAAACRLTWTARESGAPLDPGGLLRGVGSRQGLRLDARLACRLALASGHDPQKAWADAEL